MEKSNTLLGRIGDRMNNEVEIVKGRKGPEIAQTPMVSVIIINTGAWPLLRLNMKSVSDQVFRDFETIVVDNAFPDARAEEILEASPDATVLRSRENLGFCRAANVASSIARGRYLFFVDSQTRLNGKSLGKLVETIETEPDAGIVGPLMLNEDHSLRSVGMKIDQLGQPCANRQLFGVDTEVIENIFYVPAGAMLVNAELFAELSGFDEGYFSDLEDADICWRARLLGRKIAINPWSIAFCAGPERDQISYLQYRNSLRMIIKNYGSLRAAAGSARFVGTSITASFKSLFSANPGLFWQYWRALTWNLMMLPSSIRERRQVQSGRLEDDELILRDVMVDEERHSLASSDKAA